MEEACQIARRVALYLQYLGIQDAARKRRVDEGPWAGGIYETLHKKVTKTVTQDKWLKARKLISDLNKDISGDFSKPLLYKKLEQIRGFLCHLAMVYDSMFPYLKGFHLTVARHLPHRDEEGWKIAKLEWIGHLENKIEDGKYTRGQVEIILVEGRDGLTTPPLWVVPVPRFSSCLEVLTKNFEEELPPIVTVRSTTCQVIVYGFVDASGSGFGSTLLVKGHIEYRIGTWSSKEDTNTSNWREFENLVCEVEQAGLKGGLKDSTVIIATDNQVVESTLYEGNSSSIKLYNLVVRMKLVELKYGIQLCITHVSGKRMQSQGIDGVSRGSLKTGVAAGKEMIEYCPWGKDPIEEGPKLKPWIKSWAGEDTIFLNPKDWYLRGHDLHGGDYNEKKVWIPKVKKGTYVWSPPAAAVGPCLEELRKARMKRQQSRHIVIIHKLMTPIWLKQINKAADCIFVIPACHSFWPATNFEPLYVAILFPYLDYMPFELKKGVSRG